MKTWKGYWMGLAVAAGLATRLHAQFGPPAGVGAAAPAPGPAAVGTAAAAGAGGPAAPAPAGGNLWSFLLPSPAQKAACKLCFCNSALGKMVSGLMAPVSVFSGGLFQSRCPAANAAADLAKPADSAEGAAARIQMDELDAKARRAAIRYLGTVDCRYWPEAQDGLINGLRADRNECVRLEAAWALGRGCCCTRKTLEALALTVSGSERDGNPIERSDRVRAAAAASLDHCLSCLADTTVEALPPGAAPEEVIPPPKEGPAPKIPELPGTYYKRVERLPMKKVAADARRALTRVRPATQTAANTRPGDGGVIEIVTHAFAAMPNSAQSPAPVVLPAVVTAPQSAPPVQLASATRLGAPVLSGPPTPPVSATHGPAPAEVQRLLARLRFGTPADRQVAAEQLASSPWAARPDVTAALTTGGHDDPEPAVRATCLRCLSRISFNQMPH